MSATHNEPQNPSRREALRRLGLSVAAAYIVPEVLVLSEARASSGISELSSVKGGTPPTPPTAPSNIDELEVDVQERDFCRSTHVGDPEQSVSFSESDYELAEAAVEAGYAKPLQAIWPEFISNYSGKVIGIEFTGFRWRPRYRFRAISTGGRLETVIVSARTGIIEKIVVC